MRVDPAQSPAFFALASEMLDSHFTHERGDKVLTAIGNGGVILGQAVFSGIAVGVKCEISVWFNRRGLAGRSFIRNVFHIAFNEWDCKRITAVTRESNERAQRTLLDAGFMFEAPLQAWFGDEAGWMFRMLRHECPWLK